MSRLPSSNISLGSGRAPHCFSFRGTREKFSRFLVCQHQHHNSSPTLSGRTFDVHSDVLIQEVILQSGLPIHSFFPGTAISPGTPPCCVLNLYNAKNPPEWCNDFFYFQSLLIVQQTISNKPASLLQSQRRVNAGDTLI